MSIPHAVLALLADGPRYGLQLKREFEDHTGELWPINVGQVYSTLGRLERDGLVAGEGERGEEGQKRYGITTAGSDELQRWLHEPVRKDPPSRDEVVIKLAVAPIVEGIDLHEVIQAQRRATVEALQSYTRLKAGSRADDLAWLVVLDSLILKCEAEVRWLDLVEARVGRAGPSGRPRRRPPAAIDVPETPAETEAEGASR